MSGSQALFGQAGGYEVLLAEEETGTHVEYLTQRRELLGVNFDENENSPEPVFLYPRA